MNKSAIQKFAIWARNELITQVSQRAYQYGIDESGFGDASADAINGRLLSIEEKSQRQELINQIKDKGYKQVMEEVAYTWFNRFIALRFMEVNNYLPSHIRVFSDASGAFKPEILNNVLHHDLPELDRDKVNKYIDNSDPEALYRYLLLTQCNALNTSLPVMFERMGSYTEMLLPNNILRQDSIIGHMVYDIPEEDWQNAVQIIGWLYQYYNDERKNEVINIYKGTVKKEDIPAATQLFTTDWVVRYMVDNSLGRFWIERHPESKLAKKLEFFVTPKSGEIKYVNDLVNPEDVKFIDPCMGSGHILVYAFDVLIEIYKESGYTERDAAIMIVQNNLYGLDIDDRASQLAYFAVMMKARSYDRRFLSRGVMPNLLAIKESNDMGEVIQDGLTIDTQMNEISLYLVDTFLDAKELGSIITVEPKDYDSYIAYLDGCDVQGQLTMDNAYWLHNTRSMLKAMAHQAKLLSSKYTIVCTNPPYLNKIEGRLKTFITENYKDYSGDLFSVFTYRNLILCEQNGYSGYMTPFVWMFIKTYEKLRNHIIKNKSITTLIQMEYSAFEEATVPICSFVLKNGKASEKGLYFKLSDFKGGMDVQKQKVLEAITNKNCGYFYEADQSNFSKIPGSPVAYWVSKATLDSFANKTIGEIAKPRQGLATGCNDIFIRLWYEVNDQKIEYHAQDTQDAKRTTKKWFPYNKGGEYRKWYGNNNFVINWENDGAELKKFKGSVLRNPLFYFKPCISWSKVSSGSIAFRYYPQGFIFDVAGCCVFYNNYEIMKYNFVFLNSNVAKNMLSAISPTLNYEVGHIASLPIKSDERHSDIIIRLADANIESGKTDWDSYETSWDFKRNPLV